MRGMNMVQAAILKVFGVDEEFAQMTAIGGRTLYQEIEDARKDWIYAQNYFKNVTDPALIDHAVYLLEAAEAKYTYLLRQARSVERT